MPVATILQRIGHIFYRLAGVLQRHRAVVLLCCTVLVLALGLQLSRLRLDTTTEGYLTASDPHLVEYIRFRQQFGSDDIVLVALESSSVFLPEQLHELRRLHRELAAGVPYLAHIVSLDSAVVARQDDGQLVLDRLLAEDPAQWPPLEELARRAAEHPFIRGRLVAPDGTMALISLRVDPHARAESSSLEEALAGFPTSTPQAAPAGQTGNKGRPALTNRQNDAVVVAVEEIVERHRQQGWRVHVCGTPILKKVLGWAMARDTLRLILLSLAVIAVLLWLIFRRPAGVLLPLLVVVSAVLVTMGLMVVCQRPFKSPTVILPSFLLAVGVGSSVHLLSHFFRFQRQGLAAPEACGKALAVTGLPILFTSLTTAAGLASFAGAQVAPVADLGRFGALGVMVACFFTLILLPSLLGRLPPGRRRWEAATAEGAVDRWLAGIARLAVRRAWWILGVSVLLMVLALVGVSRIRFSHNPLAWFPADMPLRQAVERLDRVLGGIVQVEVLIDSGRAGGCRDPELLRRVRALQHELTGQTVGGVRVAASFSLADLVAELDGVLTGWPDARRSDISPDAELLAQELLLFENIAPRELSELVDVEYRLLRLTLLAPWVDAVAYGPFLRELEQRLQREFAGTARVTVTGLIPLLARTLAAAMDSAVASSFISFLSITLFMVLLLGHVRLGLMSMLPNLVPILLALGCMGWLGIPLDMYTMLSGSIAIGLAVDDTIHFMHGFQYASSQGLGVEQAVVRTMQTAGRAMIISSVVLAAGAFVCTVSTLRQFHLFGMLNGSAILLALVADFLISPAVVAVLFGRRRPRVAPAVEGR